MTTVVMTEMTRKEFDTKFPIVRASSLSLDDWFLKHEPKSEFQERFKQSIVLGIKEGLEDFRRPAGDLSFNKNENYIYQEGQKPAIGKSVEFAIEKLKQFLPEKNSRMGTLTQYDAFLGVLIKYLVENQRYQVDVAWRAVCDDSRGLGHYYGYSLDSKCGLELTGSRPVAGLCDLANTCKIVQDNNSDIGFSLVSGYCFNSSFEKPLASCSDVESAESELHFAVPWLVLDE